MLTSLTRAFARLVPVLLVAALAACTDEKIVEVERPPFNEPADPSSGFLGYYDVDTKQTTCGNCHADYQGTWAETGHAVAYQTLKANAGAQPFCYSCHTITEKGNVATGTVGHDKVQDETYYDVQCESCHGPGLEHVEGVNAGTVVKPLASMGVGVKVNEGTTVVEDATAQGASCAACHEGSHHPYVDQWADSRHAWIRSSPTTRPAPNSCAACHDGRGALQKWGAKVTWSEGPWTPTLATMQPLTCVVCHDPHGNDNPGNLRYPIDDPDETVNLCMKCHAYRSVPPASSSAPAPHGVQGGVVLGFAGWRPPNFVYDEDRIFGSHASTANPRLCAGCHVVSQTITAANGGFQLQSVGHLFKAMPCLDAQGNPTGEHNCAYTPTARSWKSCIGAGCHANAQVAANAFNSTRAEMKTLVDILWRNLAGGTAGGGAGPVLDPYPTDDGYLPRLKAARPGDWNTPTAVTPGEGCEFNVRTTGEGLASHPDNSRGTHNAFLYRALLASCISYLRETYPGIIPAPPAEVQAIIDRYSNPAQAGMIVQRDAGR